MGWLVADVAHLVYAKPSEAPYIGWNAIRFAPIGWSVSDVLIDQADFRFVPSVRMQHDVNPDCIAVVEHGGPRYAAVQGGNLVARQLRPEKTRDNSFCEGE